MQPVAEVGFRIIGQPVDVPRGELVVFKAKGWPGTELVNSGPLGGGVTVV